MVLKHSDLYILFSTKFLTEDGLFDMIRSSKPVKKSLPEKTNKSTEKVSALPKISPQKEETRGMNCTSIEHAFWISGRMFNNPFPEIAPLVSIDALAVYFVAISSHYPCN